MKRRRSLGDLARRVGIGAAALAVVIVAPATCRSLSVEVGTVPAAAPVPAQPTVAAIVAAPLAQVALPQPTLAPTPTVATIDASPTPTPLLPSFAPRAAASGEGSGELLNTNQRDDYKFDGQKGQLLEVRVQRLGGDLLPYIQVRDPQGVDEVPRVLDSLLTPHRLASSGEYVIRVSAYQWPGPYSINWALDRFGQLADSGVVNSEITSTFQVDRYRLDGRQGQALRVRVERSAGVSLQPTLRLIDPSGASEASADSYGQPNVSLQTNLASTGTYIVVVGSRNAGQYQLAVTLS